MRLIHSAYIFPYPTGTSFVAQICLGIGLGLSLVALIAFSTGAREGLLWLLSPALLGLISAWALGPGMGEEIRINDKEKSIERCIFTLGVPHSKEFLARGQIRLAASVRTLDADRKDTEFFVVLIDQRGSWLVLREYSSIEKAEKERDLIAKALAIPGLEVRCSSYWTPYWGRIQPPPPPDQPRLRQPGLAFAEPKETSQEAQ